MRRLDVAREAVALAEMTLAELRDRYGEVFDEECCSRHKGFLRRRILWGLQAQAEGDLALRALPSSRGSSGRRRPVAVESRLRGIGMKPEWDEDKLSAYPVALPPSAYMGEFDLRAKDGGAVGWEAAPACPVLAAESAAAREEASLGFLLGIPAVLDLKCPVIVWRMADAQSGDRRVRLSPKLARK